MRLHLHLLVLPATSTPAASAKAACAAVAPLLRVLVLSPPPPLLLLLLPLHATAAAAATDAHDINNDMNERNASLMAAVAAADGQHEQRHINSTDLHQPHIEYASRLPAPTGTHMYGLTAVDSSIACFLSKSISGRNA